MSRKLTRNQKEAVMSMKWTDDPSFGGVGEKCRYCGSEHPGLLCHTIKSVEFFSDGSVKKIKLKGGRKEHMDEVDN